jgi:ubiquinone/menaquinone biosynthesis C-methylase UbiE
MAEDKKETSNDFFNLFAKFAKESYDQVLAQTSFYKKLQTDALKNLKDCQHVVDLGCGTGNLAIELAKQGIQVTAIDNNEVMLGQLEKKALHAGVEDKIEVVKQDADSLVLDSGRYDGAAIINVLEFTNQPYHILDKVYSSLKLGGVCVVSGPKPNKDPKILFDKLIQEFSDKGKLNSIEDDLDVVRKIAASLKQKEDHFFTTERMQEVLCNFVGFDEVINTDKISGFETYLGQGYFVSAKKLVDYNSLFSNVGGVGSCNHPERISIRFAHGDEINKTLQMRYYFLHDRLKALNVSEEQKRRQEEFDRFDASSYHLIAEYNNKILALIRVAKDSELGLPMDELYDLNCLRKSGAKLWEPGRLIRMPFSPRGLGRSLFRAANEFIKFRGGTHQLGINDDEHEDLFRRMGYAMDKVVSADIIGIERKAYIEIFDVNNPIIFFKGDPYNDPLVADFLNRLNKE